MTKQKKKFGFNDSCEVEVFGDAKVHGKGQVVIPKEIRDKLGINEGDKLHLGLKNGKMLFLIKREHLVDFLKEQESMPMPSMEEFSNMKGMLKEIIEHLNKN